MERIALISVFHKEGIVDFAGQLVGMGWNIIASGNTARVLVEAGIPVKDVAEIVGGGAILGHRVVTLSREIHAGLLARDNKEDNAELSRLGILRIDLVCVDLYPLEAEIAKTNSTLESVIEKTDIGGPTMLRSAAKGRRIVICDPADRQKVIEWLKIGEPNREEFISVLVAKAEGMVANYVLASARYQSHGSIDGFIGHETLRCKYGENAWQTPARLFANLGNNDPLAIHNFTLIVGTVPSFNNLVDLERLLQTMTHISAAFRLNRNGYIPWIALAAKHGNCCGAAVGSDQIEVIKKMIDGDQIAIFGGVVLTNFSFSDERAETLMTYKMPEGKRRLLDAIAAPMFSEKSVELFKRKGDKCRLLANGALIDIPYDLDKENRFRYVRGGFLVQPNYTFVLNLFDPDIAKYGDILKLAEALDAIMLGWGVGSTGNSNTITVCQKDHMIGNAVSQQSRVGACKLAKLRTESSGHDPRGSVAYSDSFFPETDGPEELANMGVGVIFTSSGSVKDKEVIDYCLKNGIAVMMIPDAKGRGFFGH